MADPTDPVENLNAVIADGVRQVTLPGGQSTIFQTTDSLIKARDDQRREAERQAAQDGRRKNRRTLLSFAGRGY